MLYINALLALINHHAGLAYGAISPISLSESLALEDVNSVVAAIKEVFV